MSCGQQPQNGGTIRMIFLVDYKSMVLDDFYSTVDSVFHGITPQQKEGLTRALYDYLDSSELSANFTRFLDLNTFFENISRFLLRKAEKLGYKEHLGYVV